MDNRSAFNVNQYDGNVRRVIPYYDEIYDQIFSLIKAYFGDREISVLDTGCGTGTFGIRAHKQINLSELVLCDPSEKMLSDAKKKLAGTECGFILKGSEELDFENRFDLVTAIQSHHYFDRAARETAVNNCFRALKPGGMFVFFENTAPFTEAGKDIVLSRLATYQIASGRAPEDVASHCARYGTEFFSITVKEHFELLHKAGFAVAELLWHSYLQTGMYGIR